MFYQSFILRNADYQRETLVAGAVSADDVIGVIGSSHSGVLALMNLLQMKNGPRVINFYRSPLRYAIYLEDGRIAYDNTGLKVGAAVIAHMHILDTLVRLFCSHVLAPPFR